MADLFDSLFEEDPEPVPEPVSRATPAPTTKPPASQVKPPEQLTKGPAGQPIPATSAVPGVPEASRSRPATPAPAARRVLSVTELTIQIRDCLESDFFQVWVEGELSNCRPWNGHLYFTLKDPQAQLRGFMFRSTLRYLKFKPQDGLRVVARGKVSVYEPKGEYQLACEHLEPQGLGALQLA